MKPIVALALIGLALAADQRVVVGAFSAGALDDWERKQFHGLTDYRVVTEQGRRALRAESRGTASGLYKRIRIDLDRTPYLHWSWKVERTVGAIDETVKAGDDYAARVYVVFSGGVFFWNTRALNYVWASRQPPGAVWPNAFTSNARMLAQRSGNERAGEWVEERRDVRADYRRIFGAEARYVDAVALMTDTDNTGGAAVAYYGDIYFSAD